MRLAFLIISLEGSGGAERALSSLSGFFARKGHEVTVFSLQGHGSFYDFDKEVNIVFLNLPQLPPSASLSRFRAAVSHALSVRKAVKELSPDCVVGMSHVMSSYAVFSTVLTKIKSVGTERSNPYMLNATPFMTLLRRATSLLCGGYIFQTEGARGFFPKSVRRKSAVIQNAVFNQSVYELSPPTVREKTITAAGRLVECKGFDTLIKAFAEIHKSFPDYKLVIYGDGEERERLESAAAENGLRDFVCLPGAVRDVMSRVCRSSVFVLSSRYEGMPNALIEAMACGVPCVSTRCKMGPEELIVDGENGLLAPVDDVAAISSAVVKLLTDKNLSDKISRSSLSLKKRLSTEEIGAQWIEYLSRLIKN